MKTTRHITELLHLSLILLFSVTHAAKTREIITSGKKIIQSANYPNNYPGNEDKEWIFNQTAGFWAMTIQDFHLQESEQCQNDYLLIRMSAKETPVKKCGYSGTISYISKGPYLSLEFHSDSSNHEKGFSIEVQHVMNEAEAKDIISKRKAKGTQVKLVTYMEHEGLFIALLGVLSLAALVFIAMLGCFIVGMMKRRHERVIQRNMINRLQAQRGEQAVIGRRYSRKGSSVRDHKRPDFMRSISNQSTTGLLSYQSAGYPQTVDPV